MKNNKSSENAQYKHGKPCAQLDKEFENKLLVNVPKLDFRQQ